MATITNIAKSASVTLANVARNTATIANVTRSGGTIATAGLYYGFGAFTYNGGEVLVAGSSVLITNQAKS